MRRTGSHDENKRIFMDLDVVLKSHDCKVLNKSFCGNKEFEQVI